MFVVLTTLTLFWMSLGGASLLTRSIAPHTLSSLAIFLPQTLGQVVLSLCWVLAFLLAALQDVLPEMVGAGGQLPLVGRLRPLSACTNMRWLDHGIVAICLILALQGWVTGTAVTLVCGTTAAAGMTGIRLEQN